MDGVPRRSRGRRAVHAPVPPDLIAPSFVFAGGEGWGYAPSRPLAGTPPRHCALFARAQKQSPRAAAPVHKRRRRGFRLLLHPVGHRCAPRPCIKQNLSHGLKRVALGRVEAPTGVFLRGVAGHHPAPGPQYPPRRKYARGGLWWGHMGVFAGRRTPCRDPAAPLVLMGSWIHTPPAVSRPCAAPRCPSIECGGERRADARARPPYAPIRRVRPLAGPFAAEWRAHGPKGANGRAAGGPPANRERWEAWQTIAKAGSRPRDAGGGSCAIARVR